MGRLKPPGFRDLKKGDRVVLINPDNTRSVVEVTSVGQGAASGRLVRAKGPEGRVQKIHSGTILCREGEAEIRCSSSLVAGDLVYTPTHKSGLQYGKIVASKNASLTLLRWDESKGDWLKRSQEIPWDTQWFAHDSEPRALDRFFERIKEDRDRWEASSGRSGYRRDRDSKEYRWQAKERRWDLGKASPAYFCPPSKWERDVRLSAPADVKTIEVHVALHESGYTAAPTSTSEVKKPSIWSRLWHALIK